MVVVQPPALHLPQATLSAMDTQCRLSVYPRITQGKGVCVYCQSYHPEK